MVLPRKFRDIMLGVALLGVPALFLQSGLKNIHSPGSLNPVDRILLRVTAPIQATITGAISGVHQGWRRYVFLVGVERDNEQLRAENNKLKVDLREAGRSVSRLTHLEKLLGFRAARGVETIGVRVIGRDASPFVRVLRVKIDRGAPALKAGLPVVTADGVVGRVGRTPFGAYADVKLAVDPHSAIDVVIQRTGGRGVLRGIDGTNRYACRIDYLLRQEEVKAGDLVVTSGVAGVFPKDLPVGRISRVTRRTYGLYQEVEVTPAVDFSSLREMLVILAPPPPPLERGAKAAPSRARGFSP
jgi:rod shape-determining protein MreC